MVPDEMLLTGCYRATGISDSSLDIRDHSYLIREVGGETREHTRLVTRLLDAGSVIFVVSMTGYCEAVPESLLWPGTVAYSRPSDEKVSANQMQESLMLFKSITRLYEFRTVPILLLLNKLDLLGQRMRNNPIADYFPEYSGDSDPLAACRFFAAKFLELDNRPQGDLKVVVASAVDKYDFNCTIDELIPELFEGEMAVIPHAVSSEEDEGRTR